MIKVYPFTKEVFFFAEDDIVIYSTHPRFKVGDKVSPSYASVVYTKYLKEAKEHDKVTRKHLIKYFKDNDLIEYLI